MVRACFRESHHNGQLSNSGLGVTPPKTNIEPENERLEEEIPTKNHHFQVPS